MEIYGVSAPGINASLAVIKDDQISFAAPASSYWRVSGVRTLKSTMITDALDYAEMPTVIAMDERPMMKRLEHVRRGEIAEAILRRPIRSYLETFWGEECIDKAEVACYDRHYSLACAGYYTSTFREAAVVVIDDYRATIWDAQDQSLAKMSDKKMPVSDVRALHMVAGIDVFHTAHELTGRRNLVFVGDAALSPSSNSLFASTWDFADAWIMPNPVASSLGAALAYRNEWVEWASPFLGADVHRETDVSAILSALDDGVPVGLVQGRAEFTDHSMGNRALLADPRAHSARRRVREITGDHGPLPVAVLAEHIPEMFFGGFVGTTPHGMGTMRTCVNDQMDPSWTARVLAVTPTSNPILHELLSRWFHRTNCPMLMNAPLRSFGEGTVNTWQDAIAFSKRHRVSIF